MAFSKVGKWKVAAHVTFLLVDIVVLALAARVNSFQDYFFIADLFPLALSIITLVLVFTLLTVDLALDNSYTGRPQVEIIVFGVLTIFWLAFNAFSTSRWRQVPFNCSSIPAEFSDVRTWCKDVHALKSFVWINFLISFSIAAFTLRFTISHYARGNNHIFQMPLSRFTSAPPRAGAYGRSSEFLQFEKLT